MKPTICILAVWIGVVCIMMGIFGWLGAPWQGLVACGVLFGIVAPLAGLLIARIDLGKW